jgi:hypothetical protein
MATPIVSVHSRKLEYESEKMYPFLFSSLFFVMSGEINQRVPNRFSQIGPLPPYIAALFKQVFIWRENKFEPTTSVR